MICEAERVIKQNKANNAKRANMSFTVGLSYVQYFVTCKSRRQDLMKYTVVHTQNYIVSETLMKRGLSPEIQDI